MMHRNFSRKTAIQILDWETTIAGTCDAAGRENFADPGFSLEILKFIVYQFKCFAFFEARFIIALRYITAISACNLTTNTSHGTPAAGTREVTGV